MRKHPELRIERNQLLTLIIAAALVTSTAIMAIPLLPASADVPKSVSAGNGQGTIFYTAHRIWNVNWDPCMAPKCDQGTGPGTWLWFVVYDDAGKEVASGLANEEGTYITGLEIGKTYRLQPTDCSDCAHSPTMPHDVMFNNWWDCNTDQQRPFTVTSTDVISAAAYYRYHLHGTVDKPEPCTPRPLTTPSGPAPSNNPPPTDNNNNNNQPPSNNNNNNQPPSNNNNNNQQTDNSNSNTQPKYRQAYWGMGRFEIESKIATVKALEVPESTQTATANGTTTASANANSDIKVVPSTNLSGVPLGVNGVKVNYTSLYDLESQDQLGFARVMSICDLAGLNFEKLSDAQKAYVYLVLTYGPPTGTTISSLTPANIPDRNLDGVPLGPNKVVVHYKSQYDIMSNFSTDAVQEMAVLEAQGIDWHSLTEGQQNYMILTSVYGEPQQ